MQQRCRQLEGELADTQGMMAEQKRAYQHHLGELRVQIGDLEEAVRSKADEQVEQL